MKVYLMLYAKNLPNLGKMFRSPSDPYAVVSLIDPLSSRPELLGRTKTIKNDLYPVWTDVFTIPFEIHQPMQVHVSVWDENNKREDECIGSAVFDIGSILGSQGSKRAKRLKKGGVVYARVTKASDAELGVLFLKLSASGLKRKKKLSERKHTLSPFYEISTNVESPGGFEEKIVIRSPPIHKTKDPEWDSISVAIDHLCGGEFQKYVKISLFDYDDSRANHSFIGSFEARIDQLIVAADDKQKVELKDKHDQLRGYIRIMMAGVSGGKQNMSSLSQGQNRKNYHPISSFISQKPTFVDYIDGGCQLNLMVAIDFTATNGNPAEPGTLHYIDPYGQLNEYEKAFTAIGSLIAKYDSNQRFPVWGFGAKVNGVTSHLFQVSSTPEVIGVQGILESYRNCFPSHIVMSGPTIYREVILEAQKRADADKVLAVEAGKQSYSVLLIITNGDVSDVNETKKALLEASKSPLSVIIVGVGADDFGALRFLDNLNPLGPGERYITQFVEFRKHKNDKNSLLKATLEELPHQLVSYFIQHNIYPHLPELNSDTTIIPEEHNSDLDIDLDIISTSESVRLNDSKHGSKRWYDSSYGNAGRFLKDMQVLRPPENLRAALQPNAALLPTERLGFLSLTENIPPAQSPHYTTSGTNTNIRPNVSDNVLLVKVPNGAVPGMKIKFLNPNSGQMMGVVVANGLKSGDFMKVQY